MSRPAVPTACCGVVPLDMLFLGYHHGYHFRRVRRRKEDRRKPYRAINNARRLSWKAAELALECGCDLHPLLHTFASLGAHVHNGRYAAFVAPLLGHGYQKRSITERYIHQNPEARQPAADAIADAIALVLGLVGKGKVVAITRTKSA